MINSFNTDTEKELGRFTIVLFQKQVQFYSEVVVIDMSGWILFECFVQPSNQVVYFSLEEDSGSLTWVDMEDAVHDLPLQELKKAIYARYCKKVHNTNTSCWRFLR